MRCSTLSELPPPRPGRAGWPWTEESPQLPETVDDPSTALRARPLTELLGPRSGQTREATTWPRVSIVTPSYNQGQFIEETIRSVLLQGYPDLEYIIIDGGSSDSTVEVIRKYEPWLAYWVSEPDRGQAHAINKGWARAHGEFLGWINSDDVLKPYAVSTVVDSFLEHSDVDLVYGDNEYLDEDSRLFGVYHGEVVEYADMLRTIHTPIPQPGSLIRRAVLDKVGLLDERWRAVLDRDYFVRIGLVCKMLYVPVVLAGFRLHPNSKTKSERRFWVCELPQMYGEFFRRGDLPADIRRLNRETMTNAYFAAARFAIECGQDALPHMLNSVGYCPRRVLCSDFWLLLWKYVDSRKDNKVLRTCVQTARKVKRGIGSSWK